MKNDDMHETGHSVRNLDKPYIWVLIGDRLAVYGLPGVS